MSVAELSEDMTLDGDGEVFGEVDDRTCVRIIDRKTGELCGEPLPQGARNDRKYCDEHRAKGGNTDKAPRSVNINLPRQPVSAKKKDADRVTAAMLGYLGIMEGLFRAANDDVCADAVKRAAPGLAQAVGSLSEYHPVLVKVLAPLKATGEATAWLMLVVAAGPFVVAVLAHHELIDKTLAERLGVVAKASSSFAASASE